MWVRIPPRAPNLKGIIMNILKRVFCFHKFVKTGVEFSTNIENNGQTGSFEHLKCTKCKKEINLFTPLYGEFSAV